MKVYAFGGSNEVYVCESLAHAEGYFEAIDVENVDCGPNGVASAASSGPGSAATDAAHPASSPSGLSSKG